MRMPCILYLALFLQGIWVHAGELDWASHIQMAERARQEKHWGDAETHLQLALRAALKMHPHGLQVAISLNNLADLSPNIKKNSRRFPYHQRALELLNKHFKENDPQANEERLRSLNGMISALETENQFLRSENLHPRRVNLLEKLAPDQPMRLVNALLAWANNLFEQKKRTEAAAVLERAVSVQQQSPQTDESYGLLLRRLGNLYGSLNRIKEGQGYLDLAREALALAETKKGANKPLIAALWNDSAWLYELQGNHSKAEAIYTKALAILNKTVGPHHEWTANAHFGIGRVCTQLLQPAKAEAHLKAALTTFYKAMGEHNQVAEIHLSLGTCLEQQHRFKEAGIHYLNALAIHGKHFGDHHPQVASDQMNLARLFHAVGQYDKAAAYSGRALGIYEALQTDAETLASACHLHGASLYHRGKIEKAEAHFRRALILRETVWAQNDPRLQPNLEWLARIYGRDIRNYSDGYPIYQRLLLMLETALGSDHEKVVQLLLDSRAMLRSLKKDQELENLCLRLLKPRSDAKQKRSMFQELNVLISLIDLLRSQVRYKESLPYALRLQHLAQSAQSELIQEGTLSKAGLTVIFATAQASLGAAYLNLENFEAAESCLRKALQLYEKVASQKHPIVLRTNHHLSDLLDQTGRRRTSPKSFPALDSTENALPIGIDPPKKALQWKDRLNKIAHRSKLDWTGEAEAELNEIYEEIRSTNPISPFLLAVLQHRGTRAFIRNDWKGSGALFKEALELHDFIGGDEDELLISLLYGAGDVHLALKHFDKAEQVYRRMLPILKRIRKKNDPDWGPFLRTYADILRKNNRPKEARKVMLQLEEL